jgi:hypothetical protein
MEIPVSKNRFDRVPYFSMLWNSLRSIDVGSSLKLWYNLAANPLGPVLLFVGRLFIMFSVSLLTIDLFKWLVSSWVI